MKRGLGKGLDALFGEISTYDNNHEQNENDILIVSINDIDPNPDQPRKKFDDERLSELAESIKVHGIIQPLIVKSVESRYRIIAGERRWRAARLAGLTKVPVIVKDFDDKKQMEISLIENLQREDLNPIEEAQGIRQLLDEFKLTQDQIAATLSKSRPAIANTLRLLNLSETIRDLVVENKLTSGHARALLSIDDMDLREKLAITIVKNELSVRETEKLVKSYGSKKMVSKKEKIKPNYILDIETALEESLGTRVEISPGKKKGVIQIEYYNNEDLERIMEKLTD